MLLRELSYARPATVEEAVSIGVGVEGIRSGVAGAYPRARIGFNAIKEAVAIGIVLGWIGSVIELLLVGGTIVVEVASAEDGEVVDAIEK